LDELENVQEQYGSKSMMPFTEMNAEQLIAHILTHHHFFVKQSVPQIIAHLERLVQKHGHHFAWINEGYETFIQLSRELIQHMHKEEMVLFPVIKEIEKYYNDETVSRHFMNVAAPISVMEHEHETAGRLMERLRLITNDYTPDEAACTTHRVTLAELKEFEENLHEHVHLENNILFPFAINMYNELTEGQ